MAQAVSLEIARRSGQWHRRADGTPLEELAPQDALVFNRDAIAAQVETLAGYRALWEAWFEAVGVRPVRLSYEALADRPQEALSEALGALGIAVTPNDIVAPPRLAYARNAGWIARFRGG